MGWYPEDVRMWLARHLRVRANRLDGHPHAFVHISNNRGELIRAVYHIRGESVEVVNVYNEYPEMGARVKHVG